jgi:SlyX protein
MTADKAVLALEEELAFQGESLRSLNDALAAQQQDMLLLKRQLTLLAAEVQALRRASGVESVDTVDVDDDEKPPHY